MGFVAVKMRKKIYMYEKRPEHNGGRNWSNEASSQGKPASYQLAPRVQEGNTSLKTPPHQMSGLHNC